ncbi:hypothetical protein [Lactobacillus helveticus]|uniref:Addiction module toxin RelE n=2 Tax=Lactobacillus helveticus TaxID=1587 RepID=A0A3S8S9C5_LACHE|nr:hypothetical protein [Lactobacillus helveticus]AFR21861.1 hypothetical protein R0052_04845 [Lactobacillus helveticus R0052]AZK90463.1 hypothetical protein LH5_00202 [Lactobacillus helveticus]NRO12395.1 hypothetical protein [Lactobacillus helveticus]NRO63635.1 hypothetical protein [Lactobacillus helveticus]NRO67683.1 hypothetical protein [Lactobacillus helveticus]
MKVKFEKGCKSFLKKHSHMQKIAKQKISTAIEKETNTGMTKVKLAIRNEVNGLPCYEFRLNLGKIGSVRIAFTVYNDLATIYFINQIYKNLPLPQRFNEY